MIPNLAEVGDHRPEILPAKSPKSSLYLTGDPTLDAGLCRGWQNDEAIEFFTSQVVGVLAFLRRRSGVRRYAQQVLGSGDPVLAIW